MEAVELMVIEVLTSPMGIPSKSRRMSSMLSMATPTLPTSPAAMGWSESNPICVGRSKATDKPVCPAARSERKRALVVSAFPYPAYWRMVQGLPRYMDG